MSDNVPIPPSGQCGGGFSLKKVPHGHDITIHLRKLREGVNLLDGLIGLVRGAFELGKSTDTPPSHLLELLVRVIQVEAVPYLSEEHENNDEHPFS